MTAKRLLEEFENNLAYHFSEALEYPLAKPYWIYISLSHRCTYQCRMCGVVKILKGYELPAGALKKALDEIAGWKRDCVVVFTGGEVFLRDDAFELMGHAIQNGLATEAVSNGSLIDTDMAERIASLGLRNIAVSLDGAKESTHDSIREKGAYKKALNAITCLADAKARRAAGPQISVWTTIMKENIEELFDIAVLVKGLGAECLVYHPVIVAQDDMQKTCADAPFWIKGEMLGALQKQIDRIADYQRQGGPVAFLHDPRLWLKYFDSTLEKSDWKCNPFVFLNIGPDGEVRSCGESFGNIKETSLNDCLLSPESFAARRTMKACRKPCLQTCWGRPESDSIAEIAGNFVNSIRVRREKTRLLKEASRILDRYRDIAKSLYDA